MPEHTWVPVEAVEECCWEFQFIYRNELGEEHVHIADDFFDSANPHACCWEKCSGDWPGCRRDCPAFSLAADRMRAEEREWEQEMMTPYDPFSFMLHHTSEIDTENCYVEKFDTLDGTHWEIALDLNRQIQDLLDQEDQEAE